MPVAWCSPSPKPCQATSRNLHVTMDPVGGVRMPAPPAQRTGFFGGERKLAELDALLRSPENPVVTLTGAPGAGKTRLAVEWARPGHEEHPDAVGFVDLTTVVDATGDAVAAAIGIALGLKGVAGRPMVETLVDALADRELVLVLDNCEHVVADVAQVVDRLLEACSQLQVVATSRRPLDVKGEQLYEVRPLDLAPAIELFIHHTRRVSPGFDAHGGDRAAAEEICRRLDRLPLAIELVARWTRSMTPTEILDRLDHALPLLRSSGRRHAPHHRTLQETVDRSYELLDRPEQQMFARLSVFVGDFDFDAARAVAPDLGDGGVLDTLTSLVDHSLVVAEEGSRPATRYRLLEPLRQHGHERLKQSGEEELTRRRHAEHYVAVARRADDALRGPERWESLRLLDKEVGNLHAALQWAHDQPDDTALRLCGALGHWWALRGRASEGRTRLDRALAAETNDLRLRATALSRASRCAYLLQDYGGARTLLEESLALTDDLGDSLASARRRRNLAAVAMAEEDFDLAIRCCEDSLAVFEEHHDRSGTAWSLLFLGFSLYFKEDTDTGQEHLRRALTVGRACGNVAVMGWSYAGISLAAWTAGDVAAQREHLTGYLDLVRSAEGVQQESDWLWVGFALAAAEGRHEAALRLAGAADARGRREGTNISRRFRSSLLAELEGIRLAVGREGARRLEAEGVERSPAELITEALGESPTGPAHRLTTREFEVAGLVGQGLTDERIGDALHISTRTVERHRENIQNKLGLPNKLALVAWAARNLDFGATSDGN
jgi:predicted ATPase/DNA-binding CsgD family transcriptional regulator